ncbi:MAG: flagellar M-ring protein FliF [Oscillospiraceae bacterium]|nr:flagellar M-ring protein FliF [Oscillospiraceae bacterium]
MNTKLKELGGKAKDFFKNMSMKVRILLCAVLVVVIAVIAALYIRSTNQPYSTIFSGLSNEDKTSILTAMESDGTTDYRVDGDSILVRTDQADLVLSRLLMQGYPKSGRLYETYQEKVNTLTTNSERETYMLISRVQRMEGTIRAFDGVLDAVINMELGEDRTYVLDDSDLTNATASITLTLRDGYTLDNKAADAIRNVVVFGVSGMKAENVSILDTKGNTYDSTPGSNFGDNSQLKLQLQQYYNNMIRTQVMQVLEGLYGEDNVRVAVTTVADVNRRVMESKEYTQPEGSYENGGLIGRENTLWVITPDGVDAVGGVPGTSTNADIPLYLEDAIQAAGDNAYAAYQNDRDNKLNETSEQVEVASFTITDASVAVTINANANIDANNTVNEEALREHVATAAGLGDDATARARVSVLIAPFPAAPVEPVAEGIISSDLLPFLIIGAAILVVMIILLVTLLRIRNKRKKEREAELAEIEERLGELGPIGMMEGELDQMGQAGIPGAAAAGPDGQPVPADAKADIAEVNTERSMELRKMVRQFVQSNPEIAAQVIKAWLKGGEEGNG